MVGTLTASVCGLLVPVCCRILLCQYDKWLERWQLMFMYFYYDVEYYSDSMVNRWNPGSFCLWTFSMLLNITLIVWKMDETLTASVYGLLKWWRILLFRYSTSTFWEPNQVGSDTITAWLLDIYFIKYLGRYSTNNFALSQNKYISYNLTA
jgi:hypothetical protein